MILPVPQPHPIASGEAMDIAAALKTHYDDLALTGAKAALHHASASGAGEAIDLWSEVCALLATDQVIRIG